MADSDATKERARTRAAGEASTDGERRPRISSGLAADPFMPPEVAYGPALNEHAPDVFAPPTHAMPPEEELPSLEVEAKGERTRSAIAERVKNEPRIREGCRCKRRYDVWLDDDFGGAAAWLAGGVGIGTVILAYWAGVFFTLALMFGLAAMGGAATVVSVCMRCEGCRQKVTDLDAIERENIRLARRRITLLTLGVAAIAVASAAIWVWRYTAPLLPVL